MILALLIRKQTLSVLFLVFFLSGCSALRTTPLPTPDRHTHINTNNELTNFRATGRVVLRKGSDGFSAGFVLEQRVEQSVLELTGPLGGTQARLTVRTDESWIEMPDHAPIKGAHADTLLQEHLGYAIPVSSFRYWIKGIPESDERAIISRKNELPYEISELNWQIQIHSWIQKEGYWLPEKMHIRSPDLWIRLSIHDWQF